MIARKTPNRGDLNRKVRSLFKRIGSGAFRNVYQIAPTKVMKLLRPAGDFPNHEHIVANKEEKKSYQMVAKKYPYLAALMCKPTYIKIGSNHDAIIMEKCVATVGDLVDDVEYYEKMTDDFLCPIFDDENNNETLYRFQQIFWWFGDIHDWNIGLFADGSLKVIDMNMEGDISDKVYKEANRLAKRYLSKGYKMKFSHLPCPNKALKKVVKAMTK